ncbi:hypothetical protein, partial [Micromonospora echinofusca]|uniref:hypothetical protein n=1 Tax=Micromonospora echinofusca TaxID=47858 RepID=UPI001AD74B3E
MPPGTVPELPGALRARGRDRRRGDAPAREPDRNPAGAPAREPEQRSAGARQGPGGDPGRAQG